MNAAHLHLLINHAPVFLVLLGTIGLVWSHLRKSQDVLLATLWLFISAAVLAYFSSKTGGSAADFLESLPLFTSNESELNGLKDLIGAHAEMANWAEQCSLALGALSILFFFVRARRPLAVQPLLIALFFVALLANGLMARTAYLGGQIRHTEIR